MRRSFVALSLLAVATLSAGTRRLTLDDIYDAQKKIAFSGTPQSGFVWLDETHYFYPHLIKGGVVDGELIVDAKSGKEVAFFDTDALQKEIAAVEGISADDAKTLARPKTLEMNGSHDRLLLTLNDELYLYELQSRKLRRLTKVAGEEEEASFSPDGTRVSYVRGNDLYLLDLASGVERRLTRDGSDKIFNGHLDWVYQEEIYGRGIFRGYWWSPDSRSVAYLRLDDTKIPSFAVVDHIPLHQEVELSPYPKAGDPNPVASLLIADVASGASRNVDLSSYTKSEPLLVDISWKPDSSKVMAQVQDREQTWLDLVAVDRATGAATRLLRETTKAWVEPSPSPEWLKDGSFLWLSERNGFKHLYRISGDGKQFHQITRGDWEVRTLHGADAREEWIYFSGTLQSPIGLDVFRIRLDGTKLERLSSTDGTHTATFNSTMSMYLDSWSDVSTPTQVRLHRNDGKLVRVVDANPVPELSDFALSTPEFLQVKTRDGFVMEAMLIKPVDFTPSKKYPVYEFTYSGPHAQTVKNGWGRTEYLFQQMLAQNGVVVWICDNRTASGKGAISSWPLYKEFGPSELRDLQDGVDYLKDLPFIDGSRIVLSGWSYGGFMTSYALTHSSTWKAGIAGGSVTDWHDYDSVYTERYMLTPDHNKDGYARSGPRNAAATLNGDLLLIHGAMDDNVHVQNTLQFAYELQKAQKQFRMMLYPKSRHSVTQPDLVKQMKGMMFSFVMEKVK